MPGPIVIVGAGLSGLIAARDLAAAGRHVVVIDAAAHVGGRLATRQLGSESLDMGAQFFTTRSNDFGEFVSGFVASGLIYEWCRGFNETDGFPRFACRGGMNSLAQHLAGGLKDLRLGIEVNSVARRPEGGWRLAWEGGELDAAAVLLTAPVPASLALLDAGGVGLDGDIDSTLRRVVYNRVLAVGALLDRPSAVPAPGARQLDDGPFSFVADNAQKGTSKQTTLTLHASHGFSAEKWDEPDDELLRDLVALAAAWIGNANVAHAVLVRWRGAGPAVALPERCCVAHHGHHPLVCAGDSFAGSKVEGAFLSGRAAAAELLALTSAKGSESE